MDSRKGISSIVSISFLLIMSVGAVIIANNFLKDYTSNLDLGEDDAFENSNTFIDKYSEGILYFNNGFDDNLTVKRMIVGGIECEFNEDIRIGYNGLNISDCDKKLGDFNHFLILTEKNIYNDYLYVADPCPGYYCTDLEIFNDEGKVSGEQVLFRANYFTTNDKFSGIGFSENYIGQVVWSSGDLDTGSTYSIATFDCENKGIRDCIVVGTYQADKGIRAFYANGSEILDRNWPGSITNGYIYQIEVGDLDDDGFENDVLLGDTGGNVFVFDEEGSVVFNVNPPGAEIRSIDIASLDGDGKKNDFVVAANNVIHGYNSSDGMNFNLKWTYSKSIGSSSYPSNEIHADDIDGDGIDDVAANYRKDYVVAIYGNNGSAIFEKSYTSSRGAHIIEADDTYSHKEVVRIGYGGSGGAHGLRLHSSPSGNLIFEGGFANGNAFEFSPYYHNSDLKFLISTDGGYGVDEFYMLNYGGSRLWSYANPGGGIYAIDIFDFDLDGIDEVIGGDASGNIMVLSGDSDNVELYYNVGQGTYGGSYGKYGPITNMDVNSDGALDIVSVSRGGYIYVLQSGLCQIEFDDGTYGMSWNESTLQWEFSRSFSSAGEYNYTVNCSKKKYGPQILNGSVVIS